MGFGPIKNYRKIPEEPKNRARPLRFQRTPPSQKPPEGRQGAAPGTIYHVLMGIQAELLFQATDEQDGHGWSRLVASADFSAQTPCPERLAHPPGLICEQFPARKKGPDDFWGAGRPRTGTGQRPGGCSKSDLRPF